MSMSNKRTWKVMEVEGFRAELQHGCYNCRMEMGKAYSYQLSMGKPGLGTSPCHALSQRVTAQREHNPLRSSSFKNSDFKCQLIYKFRPGN